jgi:perosamine synthetase
MIPLAVPNLTGREAEYLQQCISSTYVSAVGPFVERFESMVALASGTGGAVAVSAGTTGLHLALRTAGVRPGELVALPSLTFIASANAIAHCGATPWLFDVSEESWTLAPEQLRSVLRREIVRDTGGAAMHRSSGRRLAAILPVHTLGHPADMAPLQVLAAEYDVPLVADAAAALGATYRDRAIGDAGAVATVFSFNGNKTVTAGGGGAVASNDEEFRRHARHLSTTARVGPGYDHDEVGYNYRMTNLQAAVGCAQLEQLDRFVEVKRRCQLAYTTALCDRQGIRPFPAAPWARSACWLTGVFLDDWESGEVAALRERLRAGGVDARPFWTPMHRQRPYGAAPRERQPVTEHLWSRILPLPCSTGITEDELDEVIRVVGRELERS